MFYLCNSQLRRLTALATAKWWGGLRAQQSLAVERSLKTDSQDSNYSRVTRTFTAHTELVKRVVLHVLLGECSKSDKPDDPKAFWECWCSNSIFTPRWNDRQSYKWISQEGHLIQALNRALTTRDDSTALPLEKQTPGESVKIWDSL